MASPRRSGAWWQSLQLQMATAAVLLLIILVMVALMLSDRVIRTALDDDAASLRLAQAEQSLGELSQLTSYAEGLAHSLAGIYLAGERNPQRMESLGLNLLASAYSAPQGRAIVSIGLWPEPGAFTANVERRGFMWQRSGGTAIEFRNDYNDPQRVPYSGEPWYGIARYLGTDACAWGPARPHALLNTPVVTCSLPLLPSGAFRGVVTVDVAVSAIQSRLRAAHGDAPGYGLLFDIDDKLIASTSATDSVLGGMKNAAELGQRREAFKPVALAINAASEARVNASIDNDRYQATDVSAFRDASRGLTRSSAERQLAAVWTSEERRDSPAEPVTMELLDDPIVQSASKVLLLDIGVTNWHYVAVFPANYGLEGAGFITRQMLFVTIGFTAVAMLLMLALVRAGVLKPLRTMLADLRDAARADREFEVTLDESARNEVGDLAAWLNDRTRSLREVADRAQAANTQLVLEVGERKSAQESLSLVRERAEMTLKCIGDGVITTDRTGVVDYMNPVAETLVGRSLTESTGSALLEVLRLQEDDSEERLPDLSVQTVSTGKRVNLEEPVTLISHRGNVSRVSVTSAPIRTSQGDILGAVLVLRRASDTSAGHAPGEVAASLTGLAGRTQFEQSITPLLDQASTGEHALLQLDVDNMRTINEGKGERAGDAYLCHIGQLLRAEVDNTGHCYHFSSDKFLLLLNDCTLEAAEARGNHLLAAMADAPMRWEGDKIVASASIGVARVDQTVGTAMEALRRAELATQSAKSAGGATVRRYRAESRAAARKSSDAKWVQRIGDGLEQNLFHLMGQQIRATDSEAMLGVELHVSLEDEEGFWASPDAFMPAAERSGQAAEIDQLVIRESFEFLAQNPDFSRHQGFCSINLSSASLCNPGFMNLLFEAFQSHEVPPGRVCFEINEQQVRDLHRETTELVSALRGIGCRFLLDNYSGSIDGTDVLRKIRFDFVKLDLGLTARALGENVDRIALESAVKVVTELGVTAIAGKVDDDAALPALTEAGVRYAQGYGVARPSPLMLLAQQAEHSTVPADG